MLSSGICLARRERTYGYEDDVADVAEGREVCLQLKTVLPNRSEVLRERRVAEGETSMC